MYFCLHSLFHAVLANLLRGSSTRWLIFVQPPHTAGMSNTCHCACSVKQLIEELREIVDWRLLGEELGVETNRLQQIDSGNTENEHKKRAMIRYITHVNIVAFPIYHASYPLHACSIQDCGEELQLGRLHLKQCKNYTQSYCLY